jgi:hypothetical protein
MRLRRAIDFLVFKVKKRNNDRLRYKVSDLINISY